MNLAFALSCFKSAALQKDIPDLSPPTNSSSTALVSPFRATSIERPSGVPYVLSGLCCCALVDAIPKYLALLLPSSSVKNTSSGQQLVPANAPPNITADAPSANALVMVPLSFMPPSAITVLLYSLAANTHSTREVADGTPTPVVVSVVQTLPAPLVALIVSAPALIKSSAP